MKRSTRTCRFVWPAAVALGACSGPELYLENDALGIGRSSDRHYTSGLRYQNTITRDDAPEWIRDATNLLRPFKDRDATEVGFFLGQHIYTPEDLETRELIEDDRPYAGWLYAGIARLDSDWGDDGDRSDDLTTMELTLGVVGPEALGEETQKAVHEITDSEEPEGWDNQLDTEPTLMLSWLRQSRPWEAELGAVGFDLINHAGARLGTPYTDAQIGTSLRIGRNLPKDFGVLPNEPSLVNPATVREERSPSSVYLFLGVNGRGVAYNTFLDGNLDGDSHSVDKEPFVGEALAGFAVQRGRFRFTYTWVLRTPEFEESDEDQIFGSISISWTARE